VKREPKAAEKAARAAKSNRGYVSDLKKIKTDAPDLYAKVESKELAVAPARVTPDDQLAH
jgi:hypothetical protein